LADLVVVKQLAFCLCVRTVGVGYTSDLIDLQTRTCKFFYLISSSSLKVEITSCIKVRHCCLSLSNSEHSAEAQRYKRVYQQGQLQQPPLQLIAVAIVYQTHCSQSQQDLVLDMLESGDMCRTNR